MIETLKHNVDLTPFNSFGLSCSANNYYACSDLNQFRTDLDQLQALGSPLFVLGGGSNVLLTEATLTNTVIHNRLRGIRVIEESDEHVIVNAAAGEPWHRFVMHCLNQGWSGTENLSLIPGCIGATPIQNIGAYGVEIKDVFVRLNAIELNSGNTLSFDHNDCQFGYRDSIFKHELKNKVLITDVELRLNKSDRLRLDYAGIRDELNTMGIHQPTAVDVSQAVIAIRQRKLPDPAEIGNAGSFFKNPVIATNAYSALQRRFPDMPAYVIDDQTRKVPAAWLIDHCGFKGMRTGNIGVHKNQPLVLINHGGGHGKDLANLAQQILKTVQQTFDVTLEPEVNIIP